MHKSLIVFILGFISLMHSRKSTMQDTGPQPEITEKQVLVLVLDNKKTKLRSKAKILIYF